MIITIYYGNTITNTIASTFTLKPIIYHVTKLHRSLEFIAVKEKTKPNYNHIETIRIEKISKDMKKTKYKHDQG